MASREPAATKRPRSRRSIAYVPNKSAAAFDQENATTDIGAIKGGGLEGRALTREKKSRSKSLGPGGLDALQSLSGNRRKVCLNLLGQSQIQQRNKWTDLYALP